MPGLLRARDADCIDEGQRQVDGAPAEAGAQCVEGALDVETGVVGAFAGVLRQTIEDQGDNADAYVRV